MTSTEQANVLPLTLSHEPREKENEIHFHGKQLPPIASQQQLTKIERWEVTQ